MKTVYSGVAALALGTILSLGSAQDAKADGGALVLGVGAYLVVDALIGEHCQINEWPFNLVRKVDRELHGRKGCRPQHYHRYRKHRAR